MNTKNNDFKMFPTNLMSSTPHLLEGSNLRSKRSTTRNSRVIRQSEALQTVTVGLDMFAGFLGIKSGTVLTTKNSLKAGTSGVFGEALKKDGIILITSSAHNYFIKIPVSSGATTWNIANTTTPNWIIDNFISSGNQTIHINYLQKGAKKSSGQ